MSTQEPHSKERTKGRPESPLASCRGLARSLMQAASPRTSFGDPTWFAGCSCARIQLLEVRCDAEQYLRGRSHLSRKLRSRLIVEVGRDEREFGQNSAQRPRASLEWPRKPPASARVDPARPLA